MSNYPKSQPIILIIASKREIGDKNTDTVVLFDAINQAFEFEATRNPNVHVESALSGVSYKDICRLIACGTSYSIGITQFVFLSPQNEGAAYHQLYDELKIKIETFEANGNRFERQISLEDNSDYEQKDFAITKTKYNITPATKLTISNIPAGSEFYINFFPEQVINIGTALSS